MTNQLNNDETLEPELAVLSPSAQSSFAALRRFIKPRKVVERCEMCSAELAAHHQHLVAPETRKMICACQACAILFNQGAETKYRSVPRRVQLLRSFQLSDAEWDRLMIPIGMAFFFNNSSTSKTVALYPSPAGAIESLLELEAWETIVENNPKLREMEPDTEALLVNRIKNEQEYFLVPIDECYRLVGLIRTHWAGLSGGQLVWEEIGKFFNELKQRCGVEVASVHA
jgi:hypothetical protein